MHKYTFLGRTPFFQEFNLFSSSKSNKALFPCTKLQKEHTRTSFFHVCLNMILQIRLTEWVKK